MKLTILGTGNATVTECYNTCFALSDGNRHFLVDTGGGNRILKVLKDTGIQLEDIHDIFITHEHIDHLLGVIWLIRMTSKMALIRRLSTILSRMLSKIRASSCSVPYLPMLATNCWLSTRIFRLLPRVSANLPYQSLAQLIM